MKLKLIFVIIISSISFVVFQNCSKVDIEKIDEPIVVINSTKPSHTLCAPTGSSYSTPVRFIFIIDMSMSNVGTLVADSENYKTNYYIDKTDGPSDIKGDRFLQVRKFLSDCGGSTNAKYSIMGFSKDTIMVNDNSCVSAFESQDKALKSIDALKGLQDHDLAIPSGINQNPYFLQGETYYNTGLQCLKSKITEEINLLTNEKPIYHVFFITDGLTTDKSENQNYKQILSELQILTSTSASGFNFYPVYYTSPGAKNQGTQQTQSLTLLDEMAKAVNPSQKSLLLSNISQVNNQFCQLIKPEIKVNYELKKLYAVNINSITKEQHLLPDSDADGISDTEENSLGWNSLDQRSTSINDSLCFKLGKSKETCLLQKSKIKCDPSLFSLGFDDCDLKLSSKIYGSQLNGFDTDKDLIPDFIELIKGTNPSRADSSDSAFGDSIDNISKIEQGLDVNSNANEYSLLEKQKMNIEFIEDHASCGDTIKGYQYTVHSMPLQKISAFTDKSTGVYNFSHEENENIVLLISYWQPMGGLSLPEKIYTQQIRVGIDKADFKISDLNFLGELK